jgi:hypothetical protein
VPQSSVCRSRRGSIAALLACQQHQPVPVSLSPRAYPFQPLTNIYKARLFDYITILLKKTASNIICIQSFWAASIQLFFSIELVYFFALINIVKAAQDITAAWNSFTKHFGKILRCILQVHRLWCTSWCIWFDISLSFFLIFHSSLKKDRRRRGSCSTTQQLCDRHRNSFLFIFIFLLPQRDDIPNANPLFSSFMPSSFILLLIFDW